MKQIVVLSGKGGTGKTTVTAALAHLLSQRGRVVLADADVDAPNLAVVLRPADGETHPFTGGMLAGIDPARCTACGRCAEVCRFEAVTRGAAGYTIDALACEGCGACATQCPAEAIQMAPRDSGSWTRAETRFGTLVHAHLRPGEANSGKLVSQVRAGALEAAGNAGGAAAADWLLIDGAPGIGCPVIAAIAGCDLALLVAEPTLSGWHDLQRALEVAAHFRVSVAVCLNRADLVPAMADRIEMRCREQGLAWAGTLPYDGMAVGAMRRLMAVTEEPGSPLGDALQVLAQRVIELLEEPETKGMHT